jgi:uncharacterized membrane protein
MMKNHNMLIHTAITGLFALGLTTASGLVQAADQEKCFGVAKAGQNACNSNPNQHACAGHAKIDKDPSDFVALPKGSCLKIGGMLEAEGKKSAQTGKM